MVDLLIIPALADFNHVLHNMHQNHYLLKNEVRQQTAILERGRALVFEPHGAF